MGTMMSTCIWGQMGIIYICPFASIYAGMGEDRDKNKFNLRLPDGMRDRIAAIAKENGRSMNSEIVYRLQTTLEMYDYVPKENINIDEDYIDTTNPREAIRVLAALAKQLGATITVSADDDARD